MHSRTACGRLAALLLFAVGLFGAAQASAAVSPNPIVRPFTVRYAINTSGDIAMAANTLLTCPDGAIETQSKVGCSDVQGGGLGDDNYFNMRYVDVDGNGSTFDSSSANLSVPAGATVLFAGLYWGAALDQGETLPLQCDAAQPRTGQAATTPAAATSALLQGPGSPRTPRSPRARSTRTPRISGARRAASTSARAIRASPT